MSAATSPRRPGSSRSYSAGEHEASGSGGLGLAAGGAEGGGGANGSTSGDVSSGPPPRPNPNAAGAGGPPRIVPTQVAPDGSRVVPRRFEQCEVEDLIQLIASMLNRLIAHNDQIPLTPTSLTRFHSRASPAISVSEYLLRISRYTNVEPCCLLLLLHYIDRVCARLTTFTVSSLTVHRFAIAAVAVGSKALSDSFCTNARYARVGGVTLAEMNLLEREFCQAIDYRLTTTGALLDRYYTQLVGSHPGYRLDPHSEPPLSELLPAPAASSSSPDVPEPVSPSLAGPAQLPPLPSTSPHGIFAPSGSKPHDGEAMMVDRPTIEGSPPKSTNSSAGVSSTLSRSPPTSQTSPTSMTSLPTG